MAPAPSGVLECAVVTADGAALRDECTLRVLLPTGLELAAQKVAVPGTARFTRLPTGVPLVVAASAKGCLSGLCCDVQLAKDAPSSKRIALLPAPNVQVEVTYGGSGGTPWDGLRVELQVDAWDRTRLLEDLSRTFAESGINILEARCTVVHPMVKNRFVVEVGDTAALKACVQRLRNIESVFDAYRVTPTG